MPAAREMPAARVDPLDGPEADHRADEHHPLDPEIEHPRPLREQLAERRVEQRRPVGDARGDQDDEQRVVHAAGSSPGAAPPRFVRDDAHAVADEHLSAECREQDDPLDHADEAGREVRALQRVAGVLEPAHQERDQDDGERVVAGERGDHDSRVAVAELLQTVRVAVDGVREVADLAGTAEAGDRARERHHGEDLAADPDARVARRALGVAENLCLEPEAGPLVEHPQNDRDENGEDGAERDRDAALDIDRPARPDGRRRQRLAGREDRRVEALRLAPVRLALEDQIGQQEPGDVVEQQRGEDLAGLEEGAQDAGDERPGGAAQAAHHDHRRDHEDRGAAAPAEVEARGGAGDRADVQLPFGTDVEELHPECRGRSEAGEGERRRDDQRLVERPGLQEGRIEQLAVGRKRVVPGHEEHDRREEEREHDRRDRHRDGKPARLIQPPFNREAHYVLSSRMGDRRVGAREGRLSAPLPRDR